MSSDKIIIDVGVGRIIEEWLSLHFQIISIRKLITMDKDFGELIYKQFSFHHGILLLRLEDAVAEEKLSVIQNIF